jgi:hypothetical protein
MKHHKKMMFSTTVVIGIVAKWLEKGWKKRTCIRVWNMHCGAVRAFELATVGRVQLQLCVR